MKKQDGEELYHLMRFIDWALPLSKKDEEKFRKEIEKEDPEMGAYITSWERAAIARTFQLNIGEIIEIRFGDLSPKIKKSLAKIDDTDTLHFLFRLALQCKSLNTFEQELPAAAKYPAGRIERVGTTDTKPTTRRRARN